LALWRQAEGPWRLYKRQMKIRHRDAAKIGQARSGVNQLWGASLSLGGQSAITDPPPSLVRRSGGQLGKLFLVPRSPQRELSVRTLSATHSIPIRRVRLKFVSIGQILEDGCEKTTMLNPACLKKGLIPLRRPNISYSGVLCPIGHCSRS